MNRTDSRIALGRRLRAARTIAGFDRAAEAVEPLDGISEATLLRWERGDLSPPMDKLCQLADRYDVPASSLLPA